MKVIPETVLTHLSTQFGTTRSDLVFAAGGQDFSDGVLYAYTFEGQERLLKILPIDLDDKDRALEETDKRLQYVRYLGNHEVDIVLPLPSLDHNLMECMDTDQKTYIAYAMEKIPGTHPARKEMTPDFNLRFGRTIGRMHRVSKDFSRVRNAQPEGANPSFGWENEWNFFHDLCKDEEVCACWREVKKELSSLPVTFDNYGLTHNDTHIWNLIQNGEKLVLLDFDCARYHWYAVDLPSVLQHLLYAFGGIERPVADPRPIQAFLQDFMCGYESESHWDPVLLAHMDTFVQYRRILLFSLEQDMEFANPEKHAIWKKLILENPPLLAGML